MVSIVVRAAAKTLALVYDSISDARSCLAPATDMFEGTTIAQVDIDGMTRYMEGKTSRPLDVGGLMSLLQ